MKRSIITALLLAYILPIWAQDRTITTKVFEGIIVAGYADNGGYINCAGPAVKFSKNHYSVLLGLLPSIKIKNDPSLVKNSTFMPTLGFGVTVTLFRHLSLQIPAFYIPKTSTMNGKWTVGAGIGYKI